MREIKIADAVMLSAGLPVGEDGVPSGQPGPQPEPPEYTVCPPSSECRPRARFLEGRLKGLLVELLAVHPEEDHEDFRVAPCGTPGPSLESSLGIPENSCGAP